MSAQGASAAPAPGRRWRIVAVVACVLVLVPALMLAWALATEAGLRALFRLASSATAGSVQVGEVRGRLIGPMEIDELRFDAPDLKIELRELVLDWQITSVLSGPLILERLSIGDALVTTRASAEPTPPLALPAHLRLPLALRLHRIDAATLSIRTLPAGAPMTSDGGQMMVVRDALLVFDSDQDRHQLLQLAAVLPFGRLSLSGEIETAAPFALSLTGALSGAIDPAQIPAAARLEPDMLNYVLEVDGSGILAEPELALRASGAGLSGQGLIKATPFAAAPLKALELALGEIDPALFVAAAPRAALRLEANLAGADEDGLVLRGPIRIVNSRPQTIDAGGLPLEQLAGELSWSEQGFSIAALDVRLPGKGTISGNLAWAREDAAVDPVTPVPPVTPADTGAAAEAGATAAADAGDGAAPPPAGAVVPSPAAPAAGWLGLPAGSGRVTLALDIDALDPARLDARLPSQRVAGRIEAQGDATRQHAIIDLRAGATRLEARAEMVASAAVAPDPASSFKLDALLRELDPRAYHVAAPQARLNLDVNAEGVLSAAPTVAAQFKLGKSRFEGRPVSGSGQFNLRAERLSAIALVLDIAGNRVRADGDWGRLEDSLRVDIDAPALAALGFGLGGRAGLKAVIGGGAAAPSGSTQFFGEKLRLPGDIRIGGVNGEARLAAGLDGPFTLSIGLSALGQVGADDDWVESAHLGANGRRDRHRIELSVNGHAPDRVQLTLEGGLSSADNRDDNGPPRWQGQLLSLESFGRFAARLQAPTALSLGADEVRLGVAQLNAGEKGQIRLLETWWTPARSALRGALTGLVFELDRRTDGRARRGPGPLVLGAEWDLRLAETIEGEARLFRESGDLNISGELRTRLGLEHFESRLVARSNRLALSLAARGSELGELSGTLTAEADRSPEGGWRLAPQAPLLGSARLEMPSIAWMGRLMRENVETGGRLVGNFSVAGTPANPLASGQISGSELQLALVDQGLILAGGELVAEFDRDRVRLTRLHFDSPNRVRPRDSRVPYTALTATPGQLTASGEIALDTGVGAFEFVADRLPLLQRADRWLILSGKGTARSGWTTLDLDADLRADAGYFFVDQSPPPSLSDDVVVLGREAPAAGTFGLSARIGIDLGTALYLSAMGVDTRLAGTLELRMAPGVPLYAVGSVATVGGTYLGYGQRLTIERGVINFQGEIDNTGLNIITLRKGLAVEAGVAITGSARRPLVRLVSEPNVPDPEKLSWIVLGRAPDAAAGADLALLLPAAQALLGGPGGGMSEELSRSLGFDSFSIGQGDLNSTSRTATSRVVGGGSRISSGPTVAGQVLSLGKRLTTDLVLSFEQSLGGAESLVKLTYQLSRRVSVVARGGTDNAVDIYYTFSFR